MPATILLLLAAVVALLVVSPAGAQAVPATPVPIQHACADAPAGRFLDGGGVHDEAIDCIGWWGVTQGDGAGFYRPATAVRRDQMASFVAAVLHASETALPTDGAARFDDIDGNVHRTAINTLAALGVVGGTGTGSYAPADTVSRGQMASFLANAWQVATGEPLPDGASAFPDAVGNVHERNINRIAAAGLTGGTADGRYDPAGIVTRAQMGTFLARFLSSLVNDGHTAYPPADPVPIPDRTDRSVLSLSLGFGNMCALRADGSLLCWGYNGYGQVGDGSTTDRSTPTRVAGIDDAVASANGAGHTCALRSDGEVWCWGLNDRGQLGTSDTTASETGRLTPMPVSGLSDVVDIDAHYNWNCAVTRGGEVWCWGAHELDGTDLGGMLGDGVSGASTVPVRVLHIDDAVEVSVGEKHACARLSSGDLWCWGRNFHGQLGDGSHTDRSAPVRVQGIDDAVAVAAGGFRGVHTCAVRERGAVACWGWNRHGQLGDGAGGYGSAMRSRPAPVPGLTGASGVVAGTMNACAITDGDVHCWGNRWLEHEWPGPDANNLTPVPVPGAVGARSISMGSGHACIIQDDGEVRCWGGNRDGLLFGDGWQAGDPPVLIDGLDVD